MNLDNFAEQVAETRAERGQSMREVAAETGLRVSTIHKVEHGGDVRLSTIRALLGWLAHPTDPTPERGAPPDGGCGGCGNWPDECVCPAYPTDPTPIDRAKLIIDVGDEWPPAVSNGLTLPCSRCDVIPVIDYRVGDDEWARVIDKADRLDVTCLPCFIRLGGGPTRIQEIQVIAPGVTALFHPGTAYRYPARRGASWMQREYEAAKARNASLPPHARLIVTGDPDGGAS